MKRSAEPGSHRLRALPAVSALLQRPAIAELARTHGARAVTAAARAAVAAARARMFAGHEAEVTDAAVTAALSARVDLLPRRVINATGVIVHTNLGRSPMAEAAGEAASRAATSYLPLEMDLEHGARGDRHAALSALLAEVTGAEDAIVVNNNAAAMLLALASIATGREVIVSRGELIEIGGGFRIPDVLRASGASLVEVGTTNRTHARDFEGAIGDRTALLLKVHPSNFAMTGFVHEVPLGELSSLAHARGLPILYDAGSGSMPEHALPGEVTIASAVSDGADVVAFSGDKLLGGPQAGILVGTRALIGPMKKHPLLRALRLDKMAIAALTATLLLWRDTPERIPVVRMLHVSVEELEARCRAIVDALASHGASGRATVVPASGRVGGGAAPTHVLESRAVRALADDPAALLASLRASDPPIVARIADDAVLVDVRCVDPADDALIARALAAAIANHP